MRTFTNKQESQIRRAFSQALGVGTAHIAISCCERESVDWFIVSAFSTFDPELVCTMRIGKPKDARRSVIFSHEQKEVTMYTPPVIQENGGDYFEIPSYFVIQLEYEDRPDTEEKISEILEEMNVPAYKIHRGEFFAVCDGSCDLTDFCTCNKQHLQEIAIAVQKVMENWHVYI